MPKPEADAMPEGPMRVVNVHQAKTHLTRLIDEGHAGETIVLAKAGKPWARLMPLAPPAPQRIPGRLRNRGPLSQPHRDPFDRMLAAQAELDRLVLLIADPQLSSFPCPTLW